MNWDTFLFVLQDAFKTFDLKIVGKEDVLFQIKGKERFMAQKEIVLGNILLSRDYSS